MDLNFEEICDDDDVLLAILVLMPFRIEDFDPTPEEEAEFAKYDVEAGWRRICEKMGWEPPKSP